MEDRRGWRAVEAASFLGISLRMMMVVVTTRDVYEQTVCICDACIARLTNSSLSLSFLPDVFVALNFLSVSSFSTNSCCVLCQSAMQTSLYAFCFVLLFCSHLSSLISFLFLSFQTLLCAFCVFPACVCPLCFAASWKTMWHHRQNTKLALVFLNLVFACICRH